MFCGTVCSAELDWVFGPTKLGILIADGGPDRRKYNQKLRVERSRWALYHLHRQSVGSCT